MLLEVEVLEVVVLVEVVQVVGHQDQELVVQVDQVL